MEIEGLVLAAGLSTRAGRYKMALDIDGKSMIEKCIENMNNICSKIIVVGGYKIEKIEEILGKYENVEIVFNENYQDGMFSSVKTGVKHITKERFLFTPGDYPVVRKSTYENIVNVNGDIVIPRYNGRKGHPILIKSNLIKDLLENPSYFNLRDFVRSKDSKILDVEDSGILKDIDTMEDYYSVLEKIVY